MNCHRNDLYPSGAGSPVDHSYSTGSTLAREIAKLRPIQATLGLSDYWYLNNHRRRGEECGGFRSKRLALLIRAKMSDATVVDESELGREFVTGTSRVTFTVNGCRPLACALYHWNYPENERLRLHVGSFLGVTLIGMKVGQSTRLLDSRGLVRNLHLLSVCDRSGENVLA